MSDFEDAPEYDEYYEQTTDAPERTGRALEILKRIGKGAGGVALAAVGVAVSYVAGEWMVNDALTHLKEAQDYSQEFYWASGLVMGTLVSAAGAVGSVIGGGTVVKDAITG